MSLHSSVRASGLSLCLFCVGCQLAPPGNASAAVVLLDLSQTFAPYREGDRIALEEIGALLAQAIQTGSLKQPAKVLWAGFGDDGLSPMRPCGPPLVFAQKLRLTEPASPEQKAAGRFDDL